MSTHFYAQAFFSCESRNFCYTYSMTVPTPSAHALTPDLVIKAYMLGIFPMAKNAEEESLFWVQPDMRGVIPLNNYHVPKRLQRVMKSHIFDVRIDTAFDDVIHNCAKRSDARPDTWLNQPLKTVFKQLHTLGYAHSVECWHNNTLVGGLYGVALGGAFFGESMFHTMTDASKVALVSLILHLNHQGFVLLDTQFITEHLKQFGCVEIPHEEFTIILGEALAVETEF